MNKKFVAYEKMNKKAQKAVNALKRSGWGEVNPAMRVEKNVKAYQRSTKHKGRMFDD